ncbi:hypothetical protein CRG98_044124 [Punica granatum]|uniref:Uncharacterized protein n=1 Tax=Punica granatum TaxID=22663 RepID=A0A2I0HUW8_PUNGR|nr:hypothetical protein CRG98_044124 [Punica granatum]
MTGRLPLALEVLGSHLSVYGGTKDKWHCTIEKLKIKLDMVDVRDKLKISYESLEREEKEIFLDIACLFIGMDVRLVIPMWKDAKFSPEGTSKVEAISLEGYHFKEEEDSPDDDMLRNLPSIRVLELGGAKLYGNFELLFRQLRWLSWHRKNISPPTNLILTNLIVLNLSRSVIPDDWIGWSSIKFGPKLKVLNLSNCPISRTPDFSAFPSLERLTLESCRELVCVDRSIGLLKNLILLNLRGCWRLEKLPEELGSMESLVELLLDQTSVKELPISRGMSTLSCLETLDIDQLDFQTLPKLPSSLIRLTVRQASALTSVNLANLVNLKELVLDRNRNLMELESISSLRKLKKMGLYLIEISTLPEEIGAFLCRLKDLDIVGCYRLKSLPILPSSLLALKIQSCGSLERLPDLSNLKNLSELSVSDCRKLSEIEGLDNLPSLKDLDTSGCLLTRLDCLHNLKRLCINGCWWLTHLPKLPPSLEVLSLKDCSQLSEIEVVAELKSLQKLDISDCRSLMKLPNLSKLKRLERFDMSNCERITEIPGLEELSNLRELNTLGCEAFMSPDLSEQLREIPGLEELNNLQKLTPVIL